MACPKPRQQVWTPPWPSCPHGAGVQSQQENLLLRPEQGGLLAVSRPALGCVICNLHPAWALVFSCQGVGWFLSGLPEPNPGSGNGIRTEIASASWTGRGHLTSYLAERGVEKAE